MKNALKNLSYRPEFIKLARPLRLRGIGRSPCWRWTRPANGIVQFAVGNVSGQFHVNTSEELRMLRKAELGLWERQVLVAEARTQGVSALLATTTPLSNLELGVSTPSTMAGSSGRNTAAAREGQNLELR